MSTNQASYIRGVMTFFLLFQKTEYHFQLSPVFYCSFRVCVILISCEDDSCSVSMLIIGVFWTFTCPT
ncbi:hypothetical protein WDU94_008363 [Cyamophila willieti]